MNRRWIRRVARARHIVLLDLLDIDRKHHNAKYLYARLVPSRLSQYPNRRRGRRFTSPAPYGAGTSAISHRACLGKSLTTASLSFSRNHF
jgi:hypothetical protein